ncbi:MAG: serine/threonine protein kinase, partial [Polyangiaceae bacterium]|nr:serine/threonine protein kinase [Polyangiaceae bacterium]
MSQSNRIIANKYRLLKLLGRGGMGSVWAAEHVELGSKVAIKLINIGIDESPQMLSRFKTEAKAAASLASAHVVQILDFGIDGDTPYIAMELLDGESLGARITRLGRLSPQETLRILTHAAIALDKAHAAGIIHRDMKPDNIFLTQGYDGGLVAKVLDFGIAKASAAGLGATSNTQTGALMGSPGYMSPEQFFNTKGVDHRTDLWALGAIAFECITGQKPYWGESIGELMMRICSEAPPVPSSRGQVPVEFDAWFAKACSRSVGDRFQSGRDMVDALRGVVGGDVGLGSGQFVVPTVAVLEDMEWRARFSLGESGAKAGGAGLGQSGTEIVEERSHGFGDKPRKSVSVGTVFGAVVAVVGVVVAIGVMWSTLRKVPVDVPDEQPAVRPVPTG